MNAHTKILFLLLIIFGVFLIFRPAHASPFMSKGLVDYWKFDEGAGTTSTDASGNGNKCEFLNIIWQLSEIYGKIIR